MQFLLSASLAVYILFYAFEATIRYGFNLAGHDELIFVRDAILGLPIVLIFMKQLLKHQVSPAYKVFVFVVVLHGLVMEMNIGSEWAVLYGAKVFLGVLAGALATSQLFQPSRKAVAFFFLLWLVTAVGVVLDKYYVDFPWSGMQTSIGDIQVDISRDWQVSGDDKRAAGFTRSSINAAEMEPLIAIMLMFHLRSIVLRCLVALTTVPVLYLTTQKGAILAFVLTLGFLLLRPRRPVTFLRIGFFVALILATALPLILPGYDMPNATGMFSMSSFYDRVNDTWPRAWIWINRHEAFPFGVGLGGISGAQRLYDPFLIDYADNVIVFMYAYFGLMTFVYLGWLVVTIMRLRTISSPSTNQALATFVFLMFYGCVLSMVEDQMAALFIGGAAAWLAREVRSHRGKYHAADRYLKATLPPLSARPGGSVQTAGGAAGVALP
jgi:hypothetical protein